MEYRGYLDSCIESGMSSKRPNMSGRGRKDYRHLTSCSNRRTNVRGCARCYASNIMDGYV